MDFMKPRKNGIQITKSTIRIERIKPTTTSSSSSPTSQAKPLSSSSSTSNQKLASLKNSTATSRALPNRASSNTNTNSPSTSSSRATSPRGRIVRKQSSLESTSSVGGGDSLRPPTKRKATRQKSKSPMLYTSKLESDTESENETSSPFEREITPQKRMRVREEGEIDLKRRLRVKFKKIEGKEVGREGRDGRKLDMIHAADILVPVGRKKSGSFRPGSSEGNVDFEIQYPSPCQRERYHLVFGKDELDPAQEVYDIAKVVTSFYLTPDQAKPFTDPDQGIIRKIEKAKNILSRDDTNSGLLTDFKIAVDGYNSAIARLVKERALDANLDAIHHLPLDMVRIILRQVYDRAVSPQVDLLRHYENGTDNVYGELLPPFVSKVLEDTGLKSDQIFLDLGSGVGNVVLQAALEIGCESWGCEMMENACTLADAQHKEFNARCRLWGIQPGKVRLEKGDFLENQDILKVMRKADVILVNNQAFTPKLNQNLIDLFLDVKNGCKIISLKSFVPHGHEISARNLSNPVNLLDVVHCRYYGSGNVSWTDAGGTYCISTKDEKRLAAFAKRR